MLWWQQLVHVHFLSHTVPATLGLGGVAGIAADYQESVDPHVMVPNQITLQYFSIMSAMLELKEMTIDPRLKHLAPATTVCIMSND